MHLVTGRIDFAVEIAVENSIVVHSVTELDRFGVARAHDHSTMHRKSLIEDVPDVIENCK